MTGDRERDKAAGASAARNKLANALADAGVQVRSSQYGGPPTDEDFLVALANFLHNVPPSLGIRERTVRFSWGQLQYEVPIRHEVLKALQAEPGSSYVLFHVRSSRKRSKLYVSADRKRQVGGYCDAPGRKPFPLDQFTLEQTP
jgi:hypothetical protein